MRPASPPGGSPRKGQNPGNPSFASPFQLFALLLGALCVFHLQAAPAAAQQQVWSATLTVDGGDAFGAGCSNGNSFLTDCSAAFSDDDFSFEGTSYTVNVVEVDANGLLTFKLDSALPGRIRTGGTLTVGGTTALAFSAAMGINDTARWDTSLSWTDQQEVSFALTVPATTVSLSASPNPVTEGATTNVTMTLSKAPGSQVTIPHTVTAGTAETGDYRVQGTFGFNAADTSGTISIITAKDADADHETLTVALGTLPSGYVAGTPSSVSIQITDTSEQLAKATLSVSSNGALTEGSSTPLTVTLTLSKALDFTWRFPLKLTNTTAESGDYRGSWPYGRPGILVPAGSTSAAVTIAANLDPDDDDETFTVSLSGSMPRGVKLGNTTSVDMTITDNNPRTVSIEVTRHPVEGSPAYVMAWLSAAVDTETVIPVTLANGTAETGDYGTLTSITIPAHPRSGRTARIVTHRDTDEDDDTFTVSLGSPLPAGITAGSPNSVVVTIRENDGGSPGRSPDPEPDPGDDGDGGGSAGGDSSGGGPGPAGDSTPTFNGTTIADQTLREGLAITPLQLPTATGGDGPLRYTLNSPTLPAGLDFAEDTRTIHGTPMAAQEPTTYTWTVTDSDTTDPDHASLTFTITVTAANKPPTGAPTIAGRAQVGRTLTADTTGITDPDGLSTPGYLYQWLRGAGATATPIAGATARTYVPGDADRGQRLRVLVAFNDDRGFAETLTSAETAAVTQGPSAARQTVKTTLAEIGRATLAGATDVLGQRVDAGPAGPAVTLAGRQVDLRAVLAGGETPEATGADPLATPEPRGPRGAGQGLNLAALLGDSAFSLPLAGDGPGGRTWTLWGRGARQQFAGQRDGGSWDGATWSGWLGVDARLSDRLLAGAAVSHSATTTEYRRGGNTGELETALTTAWPYVQMDLPEGGAVRLLFGAGRGEARDRAPAGLKTKADLNLLAGVLGVRQPFARGGDVTLAAVADANLGQLTADGNAGTVLEDLTVSVWRVRGGVEAQHAGLGVFGSAWTLAPRGSLAARQDGGHGVTGTGLEVAGGVSLVAPDSRVGLTADGYWLALHSATGRRAWGASVDAQLRPGADGLGLALALGTQMGLPRDRALEQEGAFGLQPALGGTTAMTLTAQAGYGVRALTGILTPFAGVDLTGPAPSQARGGLRWEWNRVRTPLGALGVAVVGEHRELAQGPADQRIGVQVHIPLGGTGPRLPARAGRDAATPAPRKLTAEGSDPVVAVKPPTPTRRAGSAFSALSRLGSRGKNPADEGVRPLRIPRHEPAAAPARPRRHAHVPAHQARAMVSARPSDSAHLRPAPRTRVRAMVPDRPRGRRYFVQLGAFTSPADARRIRTALAGNLADVLRRPVALVASKRSGVTRVLVAAAFRTRRAAAGLCAAITARGPACHVVTATPRPKRARTPD